MKKNYGLAFTYLFIFICLFLPISVFAGENDQLSKGQKIYVPAYSHIYIGDREKPFFLTVTLSIRNIDPKHQIEIIKVNYFQSQGEQLEKKFGTPKILKSLGSVRYVISENDNTGGSGANFIIEWKSDVLVNPPIVEAIMIGAKSQQGISFTSRGRVIIPSGE